MSQLYVLPYLSDSARLFSVIAAAPWAVFLDSGLPENRQGRFDIFSAHPVCTLTTEGDKTTVWHALQGTFTSHEDPFALIKQYLPKKKGFAEVPFNGGALGYFAYDLGRRLEVLPDIAQNSEHIPDMAVGIYLWAVVVDHQLKKSYLVGCADDDAAWQGLIQQFSQYPATVSDCAFQVTSRVQANMTEADYFQAFTRIKTYLTEGDCYQVNLAQRFTATCQGNPWAAYCQLRQLNSAPFSCYLDIGSVQILSSSPERFLKVVGTQVESKPIKGTRPRSADAQRNTEYMTALKNSPKDRAENVMIVDLLRNDISKTCVEGSVNVPKLFAVESYMTVHHLVSTVVGRLKPQCHALDVLRSCFPGGSITGAPKIRAMEIIEELEPHRRGVYCGSIAYIGFDGNMDSNIAIRTLVHSEHCIRFWAGGGIVHDSIAAEEYQECFDKAAAMLKLLSECTVS